MRLSFHFCAGAQLGSIACGSVIFSLLCIGVPTASADLLVKTEIKVEGVSQFANSALTRNLQNGTRSVSLLLRSDVVRAEGEGGQVTLYDLSSQKVFVADSIKKTYYETSFKTLAEGGAWMSGGMKTDAKVDIKKVADNEELWTLANKDGFILAADANGREYAPVWPHASYAALCAINEWHGAEPRAIDLREWLEKWIPGLTSDDRHIAVFQAPTVKGVTVTPENLIMDLLAELSKYE